MNKDIAREWVTALRSGEYPQGMGGLRQYGDLIRSEVTYCCLGVLCDVVAERTFMAVNPGAYGGYYDTESDPAIYHPFNNLLPPRVRKFAGTPNDDILITLTSAERETFGRGEESPASNTSPTSTIPANSALPTLPT